MLIRSIIGVLLILMRINHIQSQSTSFDSSSVASLIQSSPDYSTTSDPPIGGLTSDTLTSATGASSEDQSSPATETSAQPVITQPTTAAQIITAAPTGIASTTTDTATINSITTVSRNASDFPSNDTYTGIGPNDTTISTTTTRISTTLSTSSATATTSFNSTEEPGGNNVPLILGLTLGLGLPAILAVVGGLVYYFKFYRPQHAQINFRAN